MRTWKSPLSSPRLGALLAAAGLALGSAPALAQSVDELTITGRLGDAPAISQAVSYADLDLTTQAGQEALKLRIKDTARDLCTQLGEGSSGSSPLVPSCEEAAIRDARPQMRTAIALATPRDYAAAPAASYSADVSAVAPEPAPTPPAIDPAAYDQTPTVTMQTVTNGPVPDTAANRVRYGQPMSNAGRHTAAAGD